MDIKPAYLLAEKNQLLKEYYPDDPNRLKYPYDKSLLIIFQTSKLTFNNSYMEIDIPQEVKIHNDFKISDLEKITLT